MLRSGAAHLGAVRTRRHFLGGPPRRGSCSRWRRGVGNDHQPTHGFSKSERVAGLMLISLEDIEDDAAKQAEIVFMEAFAARVHAGGLDAAWNPILPNQIGRASCRERVCQYV